MDQYRVIGLMSGTSLDGLDIAYCEFSHDQGKWDYIIPYAETIPYSEEWFRRLSCLTGTTASEFASADHAYGRLLGRLTREFIEKYNAHEKNNRIPNSTYHHLMAVVDEIFYINPHLDYMDSDATGIKQ